jgi:hypothetical protein
VSESVPESVPDIAGRDLVPLTVERRVPMSRTVFDRAVREEYTKIMEAQLRAISLPLFAGLEAAHSRPAPPRGIRAVRRRLKVWYNDKTYRIGHAWRALNGDRCDCDCW